MTNPLANRKIKDFFRLYAYILLMIMAGTTFAQSSQPSLSVHAARQVIQGQKFTVTFRLTNAQGAVGQAPQLKGCKLIYGPARNTMYSTSIINGRQENVSVFDFTFTYLAEKTGTVTIPAMSVNAEGHNLRSKPVTITVLPPDRSSQSYQQSGAGAAAQPVSRGAQKATAKDLIVRVSLSKSSIYEQEATIATIKVYTKYRILSFRATTLPAFDGFLAEELPVSGEVGIEHFQGENYYTVVLKKNIIYPQKPGRLSINSGRYDVTLETYELVSNGYFTTQRPVEQKITTTSNSLSVNVKALPQPVPSDFSGAVGSGFKVSTELSPKILRTNEAATYTYNVSGTGNIKYLSAPDIDFGNNVEEFEPETENDATFNGSNMTGKFTATYTVIPQQVGEFAIPARKFIYFDPASGRYITQEVPGITRKVVKGSATASTSSQKSIDKTIDDILHIKNLSKENLEKTPSRTFHSWLYLICYLIVIAGIVFAAIAYRRTLKLNADVTGRRSARANRVAARRLKVAHQEMDKHNDEAFYAAVASALWGYMGDKLRIPASALTRDNISGKLEDDGVSPELIGKTISVLDDCEMARFTPGNADTKMSDLYNRAAEVINGLESSKKITKSSSAKE